MRKRKTKTTSLGMKRGIKMDANSEVSSSKQPRMICSELLALRIVTARITRSLSSILSEEVKTTDQENISSVRKSIRLTNQKECRVKEQTCTLKPFDAPLLQCLSNSDLAGIIKILKTVQLGVCSLTQNTLDTALLSASRQGFYFVVQTLLYLGANIESSDGDGNTALILSVERKSMDMVEFLLRKGANAKAVRKSTGDSCLLLAIQPDGLFQIVKTLIEHGSNVQRENKNGDTPLSRSLEVGHVKVMHLLMKSGANADRCNKFGKTARAVANSVGLSNLLATMSSLEGGVPALVKAVQMKNIRLLEILLDNEVENVNVLYWKSNVSMTALELALEKRGASSDRATRQALEAVIILLLKEGAVVNRNVIRTDAQEAKSPIIIAATLGDCDMIDLLMHYGAQKLSKGLEAALMAGNVHCAEFLLKKGVKCNFYDLALRVASTKYVKSFWFLYDKCNVEATDPRLVCIAIQGGHVNMVRLLIELGANVNNNNSAVSMPLLFYAKDVAIASLLVDRGADINDTWVDYNSLEKFTALTFAIRENRINLVKFYLNHGGDKMVCSSNGGLLVLQTLSVNPSAEILDMLLAAGVDINHTDRDGKSTLMWAIIEGKSQIFKLLIDKGADVSLVDGKGISPLMYAAGSRYTCKAMECLLKAGANINRQDKNGNSAMIHCFNPPAFNELKKLRCLVEAGACVNCQNEEGETALSVHMNSFYFETTKALLKVGADVNITDKNGNTPLMTLVSKTHDLSKEDLHLFLDHGADVNFVNTKGQEPATALSLSFRKWTEQRSEPSYYSQDNDGTVFMNLLEAGADPNLGYDSKFLMHWAIVFNQRGLIPTLITSGLSPIECENIQNMFVLGLNFYSVSLSPFRLALYMGRLSIAKYLADLGFFTEKDIGQGYSWANDLQDQLRNKGYLQTVAYIDKFTSEPKSLIDLSSVLVSARLQNSLGRRKAVSLTGLPSLLQRRLLFEDACGELESGVDETSQNDQYSPLTRNDEEEDSDDYLNMVYDDDEEVFESSFDFEGNSSDFGSDYGFI